MYFLSLKNLKIENEKTVQKKRHRENNILLMLIFSDMKILLKWKWVFFTIVELATLTKILLMRSPWWNRYSEISPFATLWREAHIILQVFNSTLSWIWIYVKIYMNVLFIVFCFHPVHLQLGYFCYEIEVSLRLKTASL